MILQAYKTGRGRLFTKNQKMSFLTYNNGSAGSVAYERDLNAIVCCVLKRNPRLDGSKIKANLSWFLCVCYKNGCPIYTLPNMCGMTRKFYSPEEVADYVVFKTVF